MSYSDTSVFWSYSDSVVFWSYSDTGILCRFLSYSDTVVFCVDFGVIPTLWYFVYFV